MSKSFKIILVMGLLASTSAFAGNLSFDNGQTTWHSTECTKPNPPQSILGASASTSGEDMNTLISQHNAYVDAAQAYMDCVSKEADRDQTMVNQSISNGAEREISETQSMIDKDAAALHTH